MASMTFMGPDAPTVEPDTAPPDTQPGIEPSRRTQPGQPDPIPMNPPKPDRDTCPQKGPCPFTNTWGTSFAVIEGTGNLDGATIGRRSSN